MIMRKPTILRTLIFVLAMLFNFASYSQNGIAFNSKFPKNLNENIFLKANNQFENPFSLDTKTDKNSDQPIAPITENPVIKYAQGEYAGVVSECPNDGKKLPKLFLCGSNETRLIQTGITDATLITWQRRTGGCAPMTNGDCANTGELCTWADVANGPNYAANSAGEFRVKIRYADKTEVVFYFNVYRNEVDPTGIIKSDIVKDAGNCTIPGQITAGGFGSGYEYSFTPNPAANVWQDSNTFPVTAPGTYNVFIRLKGVDGSCIFNVKGIVVSTINFSSTVVAVQPLCSGQKGSIKVTANTLNNQYIYSLYNGTDTTVPAVATSGTSLASEHIFQNVAAGSYTILTSIEGTCAVDSQTANLVAASTLVNNSSQTTTLTNCANGIITGSASGGAGRYIYTISANGAPYELVPNAKYTVLVAGTYIMRVTDLNGCTADKTIIVDAVTKPVYTIDVTSSKCNEVGKIAVNVTAANGYAMEYSLNGGTFSSTSTFTNLNPGEYSIVVRYSKSGVNGGKPCTEAAQIRNIGATTALTASAGIAALSGCGPEDHPEYGIARITNPQGGTPPYQYWINATDGWSTKNEGFLPPGGPYTVKIRDSAPGGSCEYSMTGLKIDPKPTAPKIEIGTPVYNCDGTATSTVTINGGSGDPKFSYQYYLDGIPNPNTAQPNVFLNVPQGDHIITVDYQVLSATTNSMLLDEGFGYGSETQSPGINTFYYCFERQINNASIWCNGGYAINDNDYSVTSSINKTATAGWDWRYPIDHTSGTAATKGRFLAVNIGKEIPVTTVLYEKQINDVIPNQPINFEFFAMNLMMPDKGKADANLRIALVDAAGNEISWFATGPITRSKTDSDWQKYPQTVTTLNPGNNTSLRFIVRSNVKEESGNDVAIDDIKVYQTPRACGTSVNFPFKISTDKIFNAWIDDINAVKCNGQANGSFNIYAENFKGDFEYSTQGGVAGSWKKGTSSPVTISGLAPNTYDVRIRYNATATQCSFTIPTKITSPEAFKITVKTDAATCDLPGKITITPAGGTAPYAFTLTNKSNNATTAFIEDKATGTFYANAGIGTYTIAGTDFYTCPSATVADVSVTGTSGPSVNIDKGSNLCFTTATGASIKVNVSGGRTPYTYQVSTDGGLNYGTKSAEFSTASFTHPVTETGTYTFKIIDRNGCDIETASTTINDPFGATPGIKAAFSCKTGGTSATITVTIDGGTSPYTYTVKNSLGNQVGTGSTTTKSFDYSTTIADTYTFAIVDANSCPITIKQKVDALVQPTAKADPHPASCFGGTGSVDLTALLGKAPFTFQVDGVGAFSSDTHYDNLTASVAGTDHTFIVKDDNDCTRSYTFKIYQPQDISGQAAITTPYNCDGPATITVSNVANGTPGYQYTLLKDGVAVAGPQGGLTFTNLSTPGVYTVTITDANSCTKTVAAGTIAPLNKPAAMTINTTTAATCPSNKGSITITDVKNAAGVLITGTLEYRIVLPTATAFQPSNVFNNLDANVTYTFEVRDANKCTYQNTHKIDLPVAFSVGSKSTAIKCFGESNGTATYTVTGIASGTGYTYKVDALPLETRTSTGSPFDIVISNLGAGEHTIVVTNLTTKCPVTEKVTVAGPTALLALATPDLTHVTCLVKGTADIKASNGSGSYTYLVTPTAPAGTAISQTTSKFTNLAAGTYSVLVTDLTGCTATQNFTINDSVKPSATISSTSDYCAVGTGATLIAVPTVAPIPNPNYEYSINAGGSYQPSGTFDKLIPGKYTIRVRDKVTGCTDDLAEQTIASPVSASAKIITDLTCDPTNPEAVIEVSIENGYPDYKYRVSTSTTFTGGFTNVGAGLTKFTVKRLAGTYYFEITDNKGCIKVISQTVNSTVKPDFTTKLVAVKCKGDSTGSITVEGIPTSGTYTYVLNTVPATTAVTQTTSNVFTGLKAGDYTIVVIDAKKCQSDAKTVTITEPVNGVSASATPTVTLKCDPSNGTVAAKITVTASGGTPYAAPDLYRYSYNGQTPVTSNEYTTTASGNVTIEVFDASGCSFTVTGGVTIAPLAPPTKLDIALVAPITCESGHDKTSLKLDVTGGVLPLKYEITSPTASAVSLNANTHTFTGLVPGHYYFKVSDANNCSITGDFEIKDVVGIQTNGAIVSNVTCNGANNGSIKFTVLGNRTGGYTYTLVGSVSGTIANVTPVADVVTYTGLKGGEKYTFTVTNTDTKCSAVTDVTLAEPVAITAFTAKATNIYCNYATTSITLSATAVGTTLYYAVVKSTDPAPTFPGGYQTSGSFTKDTALDGVSYTAYVSNKDGNCVQSLPLPIATDAAPTINPITSPLCYSGTNFTVKIVGTVYGGAILYGLNGSYDTNDTKTITGPGKYTLGVKDNHGCEKTIEIDVNNQLTITVTPTKDLTCEIIPPFTTKDAQFTLSAGGGVGPYTYKVSVNGGAYTTTGITGSTFTTSADGDYQFEATDSNTPACTVLSSVVKVDPLVLPEIASAVQSQKILCPTESTGAIKVTLVPNKGTAPFTYQVLLLDAPFTNYGSQMTSLPAGNYSVKVTDAKGCSDTENVEIKKPNPIVVDYEVIGLKCDPLGGISKGSIIIKSVTGGTVTTPSVPGVTGYSYYVTGTNYNKSELNADGTTSVTFTIVDFGLYKIRIVDENGCSVEFPDELVASPPNKLNITVTSPPADCDTTAPGGGGGSATVAVGSAFAGTGPFYFSIYTGSNVAYPAGTWQAEDLDGFGVGLKKTTFTNLTPGVTYTYVVYDSASKCYYYETNAPPIPTNSSLTASNVVPQNVTCADVTDGNVTFSVTSIYPVATNFTYEIFDALTLATTNVKGTGTIAANSTAPFTSPSALDLGYYYILIKEVGASPNTGCSIATTRFKIDKSARLLNITASVDKNATCSKLGTITAEAKDGTGPFTYQAVTTGGAIDPTKWKNENSFDLAGSVGTGISYDIWVKDAYGCTKSFTLPLPQDPSPEISLSIVDNCAAAGKFKVLVTETTKGIEPYYISVNNSGFKLIGTLPYTIEDLSSGPVDVIIRDTNGCETIIVQSPITATPKALASHFKGLDCSGATSNATIKVDITNGTAPFNYEVYKDGALLPGGPFAAGGTTFNYSTASAGKYIFEVSDNNGCKTSTNEITIDALIPIVPHSNPIIANCFGGNGTIELSATGGNEPYEFNFNGSGFSKESNYNIIAGSYSFIVKDALGCEVTDNVILGTPDELILGTPSIDQPKCGPNNAPQQAKIELSATGGSGTLEYSFNNSDFSTKNTYFYSNETLASQTIPYAIRDANNCTKTGSVNILWLDAPIDFDITQGRVITCQDLTTTVTISNVDHGIAPFTYQIISPLASAVDNLGNDTFSDLLPGTYVFQVTDNNGCVKQLQHEVKDVVKIKIDKQSITDVTCVGANDGKASFIVTGFGTGVNSYNYVLDTDAPVTMTTGTINLTNLTPGGHTITVQDDETKCPATINFNIATPTIALDFTMDVTPLGCSTFGAVKVSATNGWGDYLYTVTEPAPTSTVLPSNTTGEFGGLTKVGIYTVSVKDAKGCIETKTFELLAPVNPVATIDPLSVYCYSAAGSTLIVNASSTSTFVVTPYEYSIDNGATWHTSNTFTDLAPGDYKVTVKDKFGCIATAVDTRINGQLYASGKVDKEIFCAPAALVNGLIKVEAVGGYAPYSYTVTKDGVLNSTIIAFPTPTATIADYVVVPTAAGSYVFTITDSKGCVYTSAPVVIGTPTPVTFTATPTSPYCVSTPTAQGNAGNGQILVELTGVQDNPSYTYTLTRTSPAGMTAMVQTNNGLFTGLIAGTYDVTVVSGRGCEFTQTGIVIAPPTPVLAKATPSLFVCTPANVIKETIVTLEGSGGAGTTGVVTDYLYSDDGTNWYTTNQFKVFDTEADQHFTYYVKDKNGCIDDVKFDVLAFPKLKSATPSLVTLADCKNNGKETIKVDIVGGAIPYKFEYQVSEDGGAYSTPATTVNPGDNTFNYVAPNAGHTYQFKITDLTTGCTVISSPYEVKLYNLMKVNAIPSAMVSCDGFNDGKITINIEDYSGKYDYRVLLAGAPVTGATGTNIDAATNNPYVITGLVAGLNYTVEVTQKDYPECTVTSNSVEITQPSPVDISGIKIAVVNQNCNNKFATITVDTNSISGGTGGYEYAFVPAGTTPDPVLDYKPSNSKTFVTAQIAPLFDSYDVYVRDLNKCYAFKNVHVSLDALPVIVDVKVADQCSTTGYRIDVTATGLAKLQYSLDGKQFQDDSFFIVTSPGDYTVTVWDKNQCPVTATVPVTVLKPLTLSAEITLVPVCKNPNGTITLTATGGTVSTPSSYVYTKDNWATSQVNSDFTGLVPGDYTFRVRDIVTLCEKEVKQQILVPTEILGMVATPRKTSCKGSSDGVISVTILDTNDNPTYKYSISGPGVNIVDQISPEFNGLAYGVYSVTVRSGKGCELTQNNILVDEPAAIAVTASYTEFGCTTGNTRNNAVITVDDVKGGSGKYLVYEFIKGTDIVQTGTSTTYTVNDRTGGDYFVKVYDENGCVGTSSTPIKIAPFISLDDISFTVTTPITCVNSESIKTNVTVTGTLTGQLNYTLTAVAPTVIAPQMNNTGVFSGLGIGDYLISVENPATGCVISDYHHVFTSNTFVLNVNAIQSEICYGASNGNVEITMVDTQPLPSDEAGIFDYTITSPGLPNITGTTTGVMLPLTGLIAGKYTVVAKLVNSPECEVTTTFDITQPPAILDIDVQHTPITCEANSKGTITVTAQGGWPDGIYQYELVGPVSHDYSEEFFFENLTPGHYIVNVKDSKGCIDSDVVDLVIPDEIQFTATPTATVLLCYGDDSGVITVSAPTGGQGSNYNYILNYTTAEGEVITTGPQDSNVFRGLVAGNYTVTVIDGFSCQATSANITISNPVKVEASLSQETAITCFTDATLTLTATGGTGPYTYSEDGITYGASFDPKVTFAVKEGAHHYFVKDILGCVSEVSGDVKVEPIVPLSIELDVRNATVNCKGENTAIIVAKATGGLGNYQYSLLDKNGVEIRPAQPSGIFADLNADSSPYTVHVKSGDCEQNSTATTVTEPANPLSPNYLVTPVKCFGEKNGVITVTATGGTGVIKYAISPNLDMFVESGTFERLEAGFYTVIVQDILGCNMVYRDIEIKEPTILIASEIPNTMIPEICKDDKDGAFSIQVRGGTAPYFESLDNEKGPYVLMTGLTKDYINQVGGTHNVYIKDSNGCTSKVEIRMPEPVVLNPTTDINYDCVNNSQSNMVTVTVDESNTDLTQVDYALDSDVGPFQPSNIFTNVAPGRHFIVARHTNGCKVPTASFDIKAYDPLTLVETPGQQEMNIISVTAGGGAPGYEYSFNGEPFTSSNKYKIYKTGDYVVVVRDKNGCTVTITVPGTYIDVCLDNYFTPAGATNTTWGPGCTNIYNNLEFSIFDRYGRIIAKYHYGQKWDGRYNGADLPSGDYWYVLKLNDAKDDREFVGHFTLYR